MPKTRISLDRLLETCSRQHASDVLIAPNSQVLIRLQDSWRVLPTLNAESGDIVRMCAELFVGDEVKQQPGYASVDFSFGDLARFRAMAFGFPATKVLVIARFPENGEGDEVQPHHAGV